MTDRAAFIRAICKHPEADAPRLVYADWLEEQGDTDRAEFIRVQCEREAIGECPFKCLPGDPQCDECDRRESLFLRARALFASPNWERWLGPERIFDSPQNFKWKRGFVHSITISAEDCIRHLDAIVTQQPVQEVTLTSEPMAIIPLPGKIRFLNDKYEMDIPEGFANTGSINIRPRFLFDLLLKQRFPKIKTWHLPQPEATSRPDYVWLEAGATIKAGDLLVADEMGRAVPAWQGQQTLARAIDSGVEQQIIRVESNGTRTLYVATSDIAPSRFVTLNGNRQVREARTGDVAVVGISAEGTRFSPLSHVDDGLAAVAGEVVWVHEFHSAPRNISRDLTEATDRIRRETGLVVGDRQILARSEIARFVAAYNAGIISQDQLRTHFGFALPHPEDALAPPV